ncbi:MAG TPA: PEGA domain-containing protein [Candidatus Saccharimonadales bacterium]
MHQHTSRRREIAIRFFTYGVMTVAVGIISVICILLVLGYRFNQGSGRVEQQSLLQFRSFPSDANVKVDDKNMGFTTPEKSTVSAGQHTVTFQRQNYRDWVKTVSVKAGDLLWLNYARLIPQSIVTEPVTEFPSLSGMLASPDRRWITAQPDAKKPNLTLIDIRDETQPKLTDFMLPAESYAVAKRPMGAFSLAQWDFGSRFILVKYTVGKTVEYLRVDRTDPAATVNISRQYRIAIDDAYFAGTSGNQLFVLSNGDIRKIDLGAGTISKPLVGDVQRFMLYRDDTIAYVALRDKEQLAGVYKDGKEETIVRRYPAAGPAVQVAVSNYFNDDYLAIAFGKKIDIIKDPSQPSEVAGRLFAEFSFAKGVQQLKFSSNGRFVFVQNGTSYATYDLERDVAAQATFGENISTTTPLRWLDDYYIWSDAGDTLRIAEFDGANEQIIAKVQDGYDVTLSENGKRLFSVGRNAETKRLTLQSSKLILE